MLVFRGVDPLKPQVLVQYYCMRESILQLMTLIAQLSEGIRRQQY